MNDSTYEKINPGNLVLFTGQGKVFSAGVVSFKLQSEALARGLWGADSKGRTWEIIYLLDRMRELDVTYAKLNAAAGYKENAVPQGVRVLDDQKSNEVLGLPHVGDRFEIDGELWRMVEETEIA